MQEGDLDDFLEKVNKVHDMVNGLKDHKIDVDQIDKQLLKEAEEVKKKEIIKQQKEQEKQDKLKKGVPGKGHQDNYVDFCKNCFVEFSITTANCPHCGKETMSREERKKELMSKVDEFKKKKASREERKKKWENWRKT